MKRLLLLVVLLAGCADAPPEDAVRLDLDLRNPERVLGLYLGGYVEEEGGDPEAAGLLVVRDSAFYVVPSAFPSHGEAFRSPSGVLDTEGFIRAVGATYAEARRLPATLDALGDYREDAFVVEAVGVMTTARRRIFVPRPVLREALAEYHARGDRVLYPVGTTLVGEHWLDDRLAETTAMRKRGDGGWDFFVYGEDGRLVPGTDTPPRPLAAPVQCGGCHLGTRAYEPEASFPDPAPDGPHGPRALFVPEHQRDTELVAFFDEHTRRSDSVLGLYATLFTADLLEARRAGRLDPEDAAALDALRLGAAR